MQARLSSIGYTSWRTEPANNINGLKTWSLRKSLQFHLSPAVFLTGSFPLPLSLSFLTLSLAISFAVQFIRAVQPRLCNCKFLLISLSTPRCHCQLRIAYCKSQRSLIKLHTLSAPSSADAEDCRRRTEDCRLLLCLKNWNSSRNRCKQQAT